MTARLAPLLLLAALVALWQGACAALAVPTYVLPTPVEVVRAFLAEPAALLHAAGATLLTALGALLAAAAVAWPLALLAGMSPLADRALRPLAVTLQVTPVVALAPLLLIWAGLDHPGRAVTALAALVAFFPLFSGALAGLKSADPDLERMFDLYGASPGRRLLRLRLPSALPFALEGLKVATGLAVIGAVVAELSAGSGSVRGLAATILEAAHRLRTAEMFAALLVLGAMAAALHAGVEAAQRRIVSRWRGR